MVLPPCGRHNQVWFLVMLKCLQEHLISLLCMIEDLFVKFVYVSLTQRLHCYSCFHTLGCWVVCEESDIRGGHTATRRCLC